MGYNGKAPNYITQVSAEEIVERCEALGRICAAKELGGDSWLELWDTYWKRFRPLDEPWKPEPPAAPPPKRYWSPREQRWISAEEQLRIQQRPTFTIEM